MKIKFRRVLNYLLIPVLLIILFEWVNVESQYEDQSMIETTIDVNTNLTSTQKDIALAKVSQTEKDIKKDLWFIKALLGAWGGVIATSLYLSNKKSSNILSNSK